MSLIEGVGLDEHVRARARLEHEPHAIDAMLAPLSLPDAHAWRRVEQGWRDRMEKNERIARIVGEVLDDYVQELRGHSTAHGGEDDDEPGAAVARLPVPRDVPSFMQRQRAEEEAPPAALVAPPAPRSSPRIAWSRWRVRPPSCPPAASSPSPQDATHPPLLRGGAAAMPFRPPEHAGPSEMTIERYASVSAALAGEEAQEQVLARFGLTRDAWVAEKRRMSARFGAEPPLRSRYLELVRRALGQAPA